MHVSVLELLGLGFLVGSFGTLIGAGGGFILVPVLVILFPGLEPSLITSISLAVVFLNAASGSIAYARMKRIDYKSGIAFGLATLPGSVFGAELTQYLPRHLFNIILGGALILVAIFIFIRPAQGHYSNKKPGHATTTRVLTDAAGT